MERDLCRSRCGHVCGTPFAALASAALMYSRLGMARTQPCDSEGQLGGWGGSAWCLPHAEHSPQLRHPHGSVVSAGGRGAIW